MFARRLRVEIVLDTTPRPCPLEWLDSFCMRRFTGEAAFDDTLPVADGELEAGSRVNLNRLARELGDWLTRKKGAGKSVEVRIEEGPPRVSTRS